MIDKSDDKIANDFITDQLKMKTRQSGPEAVS